MARIRPEPCEHGDYRVRLKADTTSVRSSLMVLVVMEHH
jgi:hypothetical protein